MRLFRAALFSVALLFGATAVPGLALGVAEAAEVKLGTVDFQRALDEINEASGVEAKLKGIVDSKKGQLASLEQQLATRQQELQSQAAILTAEALQAKQAEYQQLAMQYQQMAMSSEQEYQMAYAQEMEGLIKKMRTVVEEIARERGLTFVVEKQEGGVVYADSSLDVTAELIKRYNARH